MKRSYFLLIQMFLIGNINSLNADEDIPAQYNIDTGMSIIKNLSGSGGVNLGTIDMEVQITIPCVYSGVIRGSAGIMKTGPETFTMSGASTYRGATTLSSGVTCLINPLAIASSSQVLNNATLDLSLLNGGNIITLSNLSGQGTVSLGANSLTVNVSTLGANYRGNITGTGGVTKTGAGVWTLSGSNGYTGITTIAEGTLSILAGTAIASSASVVNNGSLDISGLTLGTVSIHNLSGTNTNATILLGGQTLVALQNQSDSTLAATILGTGGFVKSGSKTLVFNTNQTYTGRTTIVEGALLLTGIGAVNASSGVEVGGLLDISGQTVASSLNNLSGLGTVSLGANNLTVNISTLGANFGGNIAGTGGVTKTGAGVWTLSGSNGYTGITTIAEGTLSILAGTAIASSASVVNNGSLDISGLTLGTVSIHNLSGTNTNATILLGGQTLVALQNQSDSTLAATILGTGGFVKSGSKTLVFNTNQTYTGRTTIVEGALLLTGIGAVNASSGVEVGGLLDISGQTVASSLNNLSGQGTVSLGGNNLSVNISTLGANFGGSIAGTGGVTKTGAGVWTLSGSNTYIGTTLISQGTLSISNPGALSLSSAVINEASIDLSAASSGSVTFNNIGGASELATIALGNAHLIINQTNNNYIVAATISGNGSFTKTGGKNLTFNKAQPYIGQTQISQGSLVLTQAGSIEMSSNVVVLDTLDISGQTAANNILNLSGSGTVNLGAKTIQITTSLPSVFSGNISGSGGMTKTGAAIFTLGGVNGYSGITTIAEGTLSITIPDAIANSSQIINNGELSFDFTTLNKAINSTVIVRNLGGTNPNAKISLNNQQIILLQDYDQSFAGKITGAGSVTKSGSGSLFLSNEQTYTGSTVLSLGKIVLVDAGAIASSGSVRLLPGTEVDISQITNQTTLQNLTGNGTVSLGGNTLEVRTTQDTDFSGTVAGGGNFIKSGPGVYQLLTPNTYTGLTTIAEGTLKIIELQSIAQSSQVINQATLDLTNVGKTTIVLNNLSGTGTQASILIGDNTIYSNQSESSLTLTSVFQGAGSFIKSGSGTLVITSEQQHTGDTVIAEGQVALKDNGSFRNNGSVRIGAQAKLDLSQIRTVVDTPAGPYIAAYIQNLVGDGEVHLGDNMLALNGLFSAQTTFQGVISGSGGIIKEGPNTWSIQNANPYTGPTVIAGGVLKVLSPYGIAQSSEILNYGILDLSSLTDQVIQNLRGDGTIYLSAAAGSECELRNLTDTTFSGEILGGNTLKKTGEGTLDFASGCAFAGTIQINEGKLGIHGEWDATNFEINRSGILFGSGVLGNVQNDGELWLGVDQVSAMVNTNSLQAKAMVENSQNTTGVILIQGNYTQTGNISININNFQSDLINVTGQINILDGASAKIIPISQGLYQKGQSYTLMLATQGLQGRFSNIYIDPGLDMQVIYTGNAVELVNQKSFFYMPGGVESVRPVASVMYNALFCPEIDASSDLGMIQQALAYLDSNTFLEVLENLLPNQITSLPLVELENNFRILKNIDSKRCCTESILGWQAWITPTVYSMSQQSLALLRPFKVLTAGFGLGFEKGIAPRVVMGLGSGYSNSSVRWENGSAKSWMNEVYFSPYARYQQNYFSCVGAIMGSYDAVQLTRSLALGKIHRQAIAHFNQWNLTFMGEGKFQFPLIQDRLYFVPEIEMAYLQLFRGSVTESDAGVLNMGYPAHSNGYLRTNLNCALATHLPYNDVFSCNFEGSIGFQNTQILSQNQLKADFIDSVFTCVPLIEFEGNRPAMNQLALGGRAGIQKNECQLLSIGIEYLLGDRNHLLDIDVQLNIEF
ncbi:MAG: autotransporter-associated beta strand repeat-containing protein [Chlamydiia bacterium]